MTPADDAPRERTNAAGAEDRRENTAPRETGSRGARQVSLARLAEYGVIPKRDLGQNFLIDDNILDVILSQLGHVPEDVILEVGAGLGVLTRVLANASAHVHAFEVDRALEEPLRATLRGVDNVTLHFADILKAPLEDLRPTPTLCASNLPYSVAGPFVIEALQRLPGIRRYSVMVQREVAERMTASPGSKTYGTLSVWVQLFGRIVGTRSLSRSIFYPQPNVDSSLVALERRSAEELPGVPTEALREVIQAAFGQRRKTLVNALSARLEVSREEVSTVLHAMGLPAGIRGERLTPPQFARLAEALATGA